MPLLATALGLSLLGSCGGFIVARLFPASSDAARTRLLPWLVSYAVGALLGVALLALLPEALTLVGPRVVFGTLLAGILTFFVLEKLVLLRHCHTDDCQVHAATAPLVLIGDAFHNFIDGAIVSTAVMTSVPLGIIIPLSPLPLAGSADRRHGVAIAASWPRGRAIFEHPCPGRRAAERAHALSRKSG